MKYDFSNGKELFELTKKYSLPISEIMILREIERSEKTRIEIIDEMNLNYEVMKRAVHKGIEEKQSSVTGFTGGDAMNMFRYAKRSFMGERMCMSVAAALGVVEVNSAMGAIVAAPTAGASGILPGALYCANLCGGISEEQLVTSLFTAGAIGMIIAVNATIAGSEGGCQAETGVAAAMAAAALVELRNGSAKKSLHAAAIALKNVMGLVCDPIAGLVECPCIKRNAIGVTNAILCADLALAGVESIIPFDEVVSAMMSVGRAMSPDLRETAKGGLAATPTGKELLRRMRETP
ncbi:MAG: L-serine ammonia-lyase, iron-sulfur-dependent, subunit alpha [Clostridia bacterium]